jgi:hypothetical protein
VREGEEEVDAWNIRVRDLEWMRAITDEEFAESETSKAGVNENEDRDEQSDSNCFCFMR